MECLLIRLKFVKSKVVRQSLRAGDTDISLEYTKQCTHEYVHNLVISIWVRLQINTTEWKLKRVCMS